MLDRLTSKLLEGEWGWLRPILARSLELGRKFDHLASPPLACEQ
jgi:hypothetical protein